MKVKITHVVPKGFTPEVLTWGQIQTKEGVYRRAFSGSLTDPVRFLVLGSATLGFTVLYVNEITVEPARTAWSSYKFIKIDETFELTFKKEE